MSLPRMRTVEQIRQFFTENGEPPISQRELRQLAKTGAIPSIMAGRKLLINMDGLIEYLSGHHCQEQNENRFERIG